MDGNNGEFPWWNYCCQWKDESCQPKQLISSVASHQYGYVNDDKINPMNIRWQNAFSNRLIVNHKNFNQFHLPGQIFSGKQSMNFASVSQHSGNTNLLVTILPQSTELIAIVNKGGSGCTNSDYSSAIGATSKSNCIDCPAGRFGTIAGSSNIDNACQNCPTGFIQTSSGQSNCSAVKIGNS